MRLIMHKAIRLQKPFLFLMISTAITIHAQEKVGQHKTILPYLQSPAESSMWVSWKTTTVEPGKVVYGLSGEELLNEVKANSEQLDSAYVWNSAKLSGLKPGTMYNYQVHTESGKSDILTFKTFPVPGYNKGHFRFAILGDHQVVADDRYERLIAACKAKAEELYGVPVYESIQLLINDGDQVDVGGDLKQYEELHFRQGAALNTQVPSMTVVGNHEYYGDADLSNYFAHFQYSNVAYKGLKGDDGEHYYAFQAANLLFIMLDSNKDWQRQADWVKEVVAEATTDSNIDFIITVAHHPIMAEQYINDISVFIRDKVIPVLTKTEKSIMFIAGHHHLYHRGQLTNDNLYHIISGGASWDQRWGQSEERDLEEVQKTIDHFSYQIVDIDLKNKEMTIDTYSIGHADMPLDNVLIDSFHKKLDNKAPRRPKLRGKKTPKGSITFTSTNAGTNDINSTEFQISTTKNFETMAYRLKRDYENLFGTTGPPAWETIDLNKGVNIFKLYVNDEILNTKGWYYIRARIRDKNLLWSDWSKPRQFKVK